MTWPVHFRWVSVKLLVMDRSGSPTYNVDNNHSKSECELTWGWENWPLLNFQHPVCLYLQLYVHLVQPPVCRKNQGRKNTAWNLAFLTWKFKKFPIPSGGGSPTQTLPQWGRRKPIPLSTRSWPPSTRPPALFGIARWSKYSNEQYRHISRCCQVDTKICIQSHCCALRSIISSWHDSVVCLSVCLWRCALMWRSGSVYGVESCTKKRNRYNVHLCYSMRGLRCLRCLFASI